jgi:hypothetical protein
MSEPVPPIAAKYVYEEPDMPRLLQRIAEGDKDAFHGFYRHYGPRVAAVVRKRVVARVHVPCFDCMSLGADITKFLTCNAPSWFCVACITREVILTPPENIDHVSKFVRQQIETGVLSAFEDDAARTPRGVAFGPGGNGL